MISHVISNDWLSTLVVVISFCMMLITFGLYIRRKDSFRDTVAQFECAEQISNSLFEKITELDVDGLPLVLQEILQSLASALLDGDLAARLLNNIKDEDSNHDTGYSQEILSSLVRLQQEQPSLFTDFVNCFRLIQASTIYTWSPSPADVLLHMKRSLLSEKDRFAVEAFVTRGRLPLNPTLIVARGRKAAVA